ncbi:MAG: hypothetical protein IT534_09635 [Bauldia sp.]|nr:hypothetical protein [Bauldia sp.]
MTSVETVALRGARLALGAVFAAAALTLAACGDDTPTSTPASPATPAASTPPPFVPGVPTGPLNLSVADLVGQWAPDAAACADTAAVMNISSTAVIRPGGVRSTINATAVSGGALTLQLAQTVNGIRRSEVWRFESTTTALPVLGLSVTVDGGEPVTWVRCTAGVI